MRAGTTDLIRYGPEPSGGSSVLSRDVALLAVGVGSLPVVLGQDEQLADDVRQLAVAGLVEGEGHLAVAGLLRLDDMLVVVGLLRIVLLEHVEGADDVVGVTGSPSCHFAPSRRR